MAPNDLRGNGWMHSFPCCATLDGVDEFGRVDHDRLRLQPVFDQPQRVARPQYVRDDIHTHGDSSTSAQQWFAASRKSFSSSRPWTSHSNRPWTSHSSKKLKIGEPQDFRRLNDIPRRRQSFRPLELSIYAPECRLSPLPDFTDENWTMPTGLQKPNSAHLPSEQRGASSHTYTDSVLSTRTFTIRRKPLSVKSHSDAQGQLIRSGSTGTTSGGTEGDVPLGHTRSLTDSGISPPPNAQLAYPPQSRSSSSSSQRQTRGHSTATRNRSATEPGPRISNFRRTKADVDEAIRELRTIVEERRTDQMRSGTTSPRHAPGHENAMPLRAQHPNTSPQLLHQPHVPALVPRMKVHARSQTLLDIGSALSTPLSDKSLPATPPPDVGIRTISTTTLTRSPPGKPKLTLFPADAPLPPATVSPSSALQMFNKNRLSQWFRRSFTSKNDAWDCECEAESHDHEQPSGHNAQAYSFYQCHAATTANNYPQSNPDQVPDLVSDTAGSHSRTSPSSSTVSFEYGPSGTNVPFAVHLEKRAQEAPMTMQRRGFSVGTVNGVPPPPAYEEVDPHPKDSAGPRASVIGIAF